MLCLVMSVATVFLFASCTKKDEEVTAKETATQQVTTVQLRDKIKADGFLPEMLPDGFPDFLPEGITCKSQAKYFADEKTYGYPVDFYRLRLVGASYPFDVLGTIFRGRGWSGGSAVYTDDGEDGEQGTSSIQGYWSNGKYICKITESEFDADTQQFTVSLDVYEDYFDFPADVEKYFPAFDAPNIGTARFSVFNNDGKELKGGELAQELGNIGTIDSYKWRCDCNGDSLFAGVEFSVFDGYVSALADAGFALTETEGSNEQGNYCTIEAKKVIDGKTYYAYFTYVEYLKTVSCAYMNDLDFFNKYDV